jgi:hypothetical protein
MTRWPLRSRRDLYESLPIAKACVGGRMITGGQMGKMAGEDTVEVRHQKVRR